MTWTTDKPTKPGWYWWRDHSFHPESVTVMKIRLDHIEGNDLITYRPNNASALRFYYVWELPGQWAGPIAPPDDEGGAG